MYFDDYWTVINYAEHLIDEGWDTDDVFHFLRAPWSFREEMQAWIQDRRGPKLHEWILGEVKTRRALMAGTASPLTQHDEMHMIAARRTQAETPGAACGLCAAVGEDICVGCSKIAREKP